MNTISVQHYFDASHQLTDSDLLVTKACARLHGHTYAVKIKIRAKELNKAGMIIDFTSIKQAIDILDHRHINDVFKEHRIESQPTAENIAIFIYDIVSKLGLDVRRVAVAEGYKGPQKASWAIYEA